MCLARSRVIESRTGMRGGASGGRNGLFDRPEKTMVFWSEPQASGTAAVATSIMLKLKIVICTAAFAACALAKEEAAHHPRRNRSQPPHRRLSRGMHNIATTDDGKHTAFYNTWDETWNAAASRQKHNAAASTTGERCIKRNKSKSSSSSGKMGSSKSSSSTTRHPTTSPAPSLAPTTSPRPTPVPTAYPTTPSGKGKSRSKSKSTSSSKSGKRGSLPYCPEGDDDDSANNGNDNNEGVVEDAPGSVEDDGLRLRDCAAIARGAPAPAAATLAAVLQVRIYLLTATDPNAPDVSVGTVLPRLQETVAPRLAGCRRRRRRNLSNDNDVAHVLLRDATQGLLLARNVDCTTGETVSPASEGAVCHADDLMIEVFAAPGASAVHLDPDFVASALATDPGVVAAEVLAEVSDEGTVDTHNNNDGSPTMAPTLGISAIRGELASSSRYGVGPIVGLAAGGLLLWFAIMAVGRRRHMRNRAALEKSDSLLSPYDTTILTVPREGGDDDEDVFIEGSEMYAEDAEVSTNSARRRRDGHIFDEQDLVLDNWRVPDLSMDEQEVLLGPDGTPLYHLPPSDEIRGASMSGAHRKFYC